MSEKLELFLEDAKEQLGGTEQDILKLEESPDDVDKELINRIFRSIHTVKGGAGFLGLTQLHELSHAMEDVLDNVRSMKLLPTQARCNILLTSLDMLISMLDAPEEVFNISDNIEDLGRILEDQEEDGQEDDGQTQSQADTEDGSDKVAFGIPKCPAMFRLAQEEIDDFEGRLFSLYVLSFNYLTDASGDAISHDEIAKKLDEIGYLLNSVVNPDELSALPKKNSTPNEDDAAPFFALFATVLSKSNMINYLEIAPSQVHSRSSDENLVLMHALVSEEKNGQHQDEAPEDHEATSDSSQENANQEDTSQEVQELQQTDGETTSDTESETESTNIVDFIQEKIAPDPIEPPAPQHRKPKVEAMDTTSPTEASPDKKDGTVNSIRVSVDILDSLMNLAGELVLTRNQLNQNVSTWNQYAIGVAAQRLDSVTSELQASIMDTRMQPIGVVFSKFQRVVRDMSNKLNKQIKFEVEGEEVELDKTIIENIGDPLTHLVRNAIDHGLETPEQRQGLGKNPVGTLKLTAKHEAGYVLISIEDDGAGIDVEKIKAKALEKGLADKTRLAEMSEKEIIKFILEPGFSTATEVTDISGRGVGMDVVFTNLSQLGGTIDIDTTLGEGSIFQVKLPLTLAIIPCLLVEVNKERYALPQVSLVELVRIRPAQVKKRMETIGDSVVVRLRGNLLPIVRLRDFLRIDTEQEKEQAFDGKHSINIVVVAAGDYRYGIVVDDLLDSEEIVVKPLGQHVRECQGYAGATILGDGSASLILDVVGIANDMNLSAENQEKDKLLKTAQESAGNEESLLIIENTPGEQFAIQLSYIHRIERIKHDAIETIDNKAVIKYRGGCLRLYFLHEALKVKAMEEQTHLFLIVFPIDGVEVAVVASNILDIIDIECKVDTGTFKQPGVTGSTIISDQITLLLDLFGLIRFITSGSSTTPEYASVDAKQEHTVLVVEDSAFFRTQIQDLLEAHHVKVLLAEDGEIGLSTLKQHADSIDLVLSDIEMPNMNGLEMTKQIRAMERFKDLPIIVLSTVDKNDQMVEGNMDGITEYLVKMDQELVMNTVSKYLNNSDAGGSYEQCA